MTTKMKLELTPEQIEIIMSKHPDFDFVKFDRWYSYVLEELSKPKPIVLNHSANKVWAK